MFVDIQYIHIYNLQTQLGGYLVLCLVMFCLPFSFSLFCPFLSGAGAYSITFYAVSIFLSALCHNGLCLVIFVE